MKKRKKRATHIRVFGQDMLLPPKEAEKVSVSIGDAILSMMKEQKPRPVVFVDCSHIR